MAREIFYTYSASAVPPDPTVNSTKYTAPLAYPVGGGYFKAIAREGGVITAVTSKSFERAPEDYTWSQLVEKSYDGSTNFDIIPSGISSGKTNFSISLYIKTTETRSSGTFWQRPCIIGDSTDGAYSGDFGIITNSGYAGIWNGLGNDGGIVSSKLINDNIEHHICCTYNNSVMILYIDKVEVCRMSSSGACDNYGWYLMAQHYYLGGANYYHQGTTSEVKIFNRVLSQDEINSL